MNRKEGVAHPEYDYTFERGINGFPGCAFERRIHITPTENQLREYRQKKAIVEKLGGNMIRFDYECAGENPRFTKQDCDEMIEAVRVAYPDFDIYDTWNGVGTYHFSVSIRKRDEEEL